MNQPFRIRIGRIRYFKRSINKTDLPIQEQYYPAHENGSEKWAVWYRENAHWDPANWRHLCEYRRVA